MRESVSKKSTIPKKFLHPILESFCIAPKALTTSGSTSWCLQPEAADWLIAQSYQDGASIPSGQGYTRRSWNYMIYGGRGVTQPVWSELWRTFSNLQQWVSDGLMLLEIWEEVSEGVHF